MANIYADAAPDLVTVIDNVPTISNTIVDQQDNLNATLLAATGLANNGYDTLAPAADDFIAAIHRFRAPLKVLGDYSPEFGCILQGHRAGRRQVRPDHRRHPTRRCSSRPTSSRAHRPTPIRRACRSSTQRGGPNCRGLPDIPSKQFGGSWYRTPFLVTDNAYVPYQPNTEVQFDAPSTAAVPVQRCLRGTGRVLMNDSTRTLIKVSIFTVVMLLVSAGLVVVFGEFRFASGNTYHAQFHDASRLKTGEDVRIAGVPVGTVDKSN